MGTKKEKKSNDRHSKLVEGIILLGIGTIFLLSNLDIIPGIGRVWPLFLIVIGLALLAGAFDRRSSIPVSAPPSEQELTQPPPSPQ